MNLKESVAMAELSRPCKANNKLSARQVALRVFQISAAAGQPYQNTTPKAWAKRWLASDEFVLVEIDAHRAALASNNIIEKQVLYNLQAGAENLEPIVVDLNKQEKGRILIGGQPYVPDIIVVDGKHRHQAAIRQGLTRLKAWVGTRALRKMGIRAGSPQLTIKASASVAPQTKLDAQMLYAAGRPIARQEVAQEGVAPRAAMPGVKNTGRSMQPVTPGQAPVVYSRKKMRGAGGTGSTGGTGGGVGGPGSGGHSAGPSGPGASLSQGSGNNPSMARVTLSTRKSIKSAKTGNDPSDKKSVIDPSDTGWPPDPSDREDVGPTEVQEENVAVLRIKGKPSTVRPNSPVYQSPGSGVGPRTKASTGASNSELSKYGMKSNRNPKVGASRSELSRSISGCGCVSADARRNMLKAERVLVNKIVTEYQAACKAGYKPKMEATSPPGCEHVVKGLKKSGNVDNPFAVAWWMHDQGKC